MELEDNFTDQYFKQYMDVLKQPNELDAYAEGSYNAAKATDPKYAASQQVLSGVASGFQAASNKQRQEKLSPIMEQTGQLYAAEAMLRSQQQESQARDMNVKKFFQQNAVNISNFSKANQAGDTEAINNIGSTLVRSYKQIFNDNTIGGYSHTHDGEIYYENLETGKIEGISLASLISQLGLSEALWGDDALKVMSGLSSGAKEKYQNTQELERQKLALGQANIDDKRSHTNLQNMQAGKIGHEMDNPPMTETQKTMMQSANKHVGELQQKAINNKILVETLNEMEGWIEEANAKGQVGSNLKATLERNYAKYYTGDNEAATLAEMAKQVFFNRIKEAGGSNPSTKEFESVLETIPSVDKNPKAAKKAIERERKNALKQMHRFEQTQKHFYDNNYQVNPYDESFLDNTEESFNKFSDQYTPKKYVVMTNKETGEPMEVPFNKVELFKQNGYE